MPVVDRVVRLWADREVFLDGLDRLPRTFCHRDAFRSNLFLRPEQDGGEPIVAIDWAYAGIGPVGEEIAPLITAAPAGDGAELAPWMVGAAVWDGYLQGLSDFGPLTWIKATGEQTGDALTLIEHVMPPGAGGPWHLHHSEDESFYVIEGEVLFIVGDEHQRITAGPGTFVFGPRGIPHGFLVTGSSPARMLLEATPAGFENFVLALAEPAPASGFAPAGPPERWRQSRAGSRR